MRFSELPLHATTVAALEAMGFEEATPVQAQTIPLLLEGKDVLAQAQTGTGKTAAFGIPLIEAAHHQRRGLVLCPTRELAQQVQRELQSIAKDSPADVVCLTGGAHFGDQVRALKHHPNAILVATPGRIVDHLGRGTVDLSGMAILVLDEADEMMSMGFQDELDAIVAALPTPRQTMLFSATLAPQIENLARNAMREPVTVRAGGRGATAPLIEQAFAVVPGMYRGDAVRRLISVSKPKAALLFCRTRARVEELQAELADLRPEALHGGMEQPARDAALHRLRSGRTQLMIATDVAARGLDVEDIELVLHDEPAADVETYIHRIGRTGRAGREGRSILLLPPGGLRRLNFLERTVGRLAKVEIPDDQALSEAVAATTVARLQAAEVDPRAATVLDLALKAGMTPEDVARRAIALLQPPPPARQGPHAPLGQNQQRSGPEGGFARPGQGAVPGANAPPGTWAQDQPGGEGDGPMTTVISVKLGAVDGFRPGDVVGMFVREGGLAANAIGRIDILPQVTMVEVPEAEATRLIGALHRAQFRTRRAMPRLADGWRFKANRGR